MGLGFGLGVSTSFYTSTPAWWTVGDFVGLDFGADGLALDFVNDRYMKSNTTASLVELGHSSTHASDILALNANGTYDNFTANQIPRNQLGLQVVPTRTNLFARSGELTSAYWNTSDITVEAASMVLPDLSTGGAKLTRTASGNPRVFKSSSNHLVGDFFCSSIFIKAGTSNTCWLEHYNGGVGNPTFVSSGILSGPGAISATGPAVVSGLSQTEWTHAYIVSESIGTRIEFSLKLHGVTTGEFIYAWGAQLEKGGFPTPHIPTTDTSLTRAGNQERIAGLSLPTGIEYCMVAEMLDPGGNGSASAQFNNGTNAERVGDAQGASFGHEVASGGVANASTSLGTQPSGIFAYVGSATPNFAKGQIVGGADIPADISVVYPTLDQLALGGAGYSADSNTHLRVKEFYLRTNFAPDAVSFAQMLTLATTRKAAYV